MRTIRPKRLSGLLFCIAILAGSPAFAAEVTFDRLVNADREPRCA